MSLYNLCAQLKSFRFFLFPLIRPLLSVSRQPPLLLLARPQRKQLLLPPWVPRPAHNLFLHLPPLLPPPLLLFPQAARRLPLLRTETRSRSAPRSHAEQPKVGSRSSPIPDPRTLLNLPRRHIRVRRRRQHRRPQSCLRRIITYSSINTAHLRPCRITLRE